jgi:tetratricopeptide (TPR) repeat protein
MNEMARVINNLSQGWLHMITNCRLRTGKSNLFCSDLLHSALFSLSLFYEMRCRSLEAIALFKESIEYLKTVQVEFEGTEDSFSFNSVLGHIMAYLGIHHTYIDQYEMSRAYLNESIQLLENNQSRVEKAQAQVMLATTYSTQGQLQEAITLLKQTREVFRESDDKWWYALSTVHIAVNYMNFGKLQESEALFQEGFQLVEPGDLHSEIPLRGSFAYLLYLKGDYDRAEQLMRENLQLSYRFGNFRLTASTLFDLGRVALVTQQIDMAEEYIQRSINLLTEYGELGELALHRIYLGRCYAARSDFRAARNQFRHVIMCGQELDEPHMTYWGLVSIARTYKEEGQTEKALEISLALRHFPIQYIRIKGEGDRLLADLQAELPQWQVDAIMKQVDSKVSPDPAGANALAYALEHVTE